MERVRSWKYWSRLRESALLVVAVIAIRTYQHRNLPSGTAPALEGTNLSGQSVSLDAYRGKPVVLHFWATWCGVCRAEQSSIDGLARELPVVTIASQSGTPSEVRAYVMQHGVTPSVLVDGAGALAKRYGVHSFPTTFVLDATGKISFAEVGYTTQLGLRARVWLAGL